jgi:type I restriction enzyme, S subunit
MESDWKTKSLKECGTWRSGGTPSKSKPEYWNGEIPWISAKSLKDFFVEDSEDRITELGLKNGTRLVPKDSILFVVRGMSLKSEFRMGVSQRPVAFNQDLRALEPHDDMHPYFLAYAIKAKTHEILDLVGEAGHGTGVLPTDRIQAVQIPDIALHEQQNIVHFVKSLDDKIELNRRMNGTLEGMAQALFKSWFVDFDPVIDNALVAGNPIPEELADRAEVRRANGTANREAAKPFPAAFQQTKELGWIPEGWEILKLKECTTKIGSGATPRGGQDAYIDEGIRLVRSQNIHDSEFRWEGMVCIDDENAERLKGVTLQRNDVLINITGDSILRTCVIDSSVLPARVNQHVAILRTKDWLPPHYLHQFIVREEYKTYLMGFDAGGSRQAITKGHLEESKIIVPSRNALQQYASIVDPYFDRKNANCLLARNLTKLRDTLLPKLISGELRIPDAEKLAESALA